MENSKIGNIEAVLCVFIAIVVHTVLSLPKTLITNTKSAAILNTIYVTILALCFVYIVYKLFKAFPNKDIIDITEFLGGKTLKTIVGFIFMAYLIISYSIFLRNFCEALKIVYYPSTNIFFVLIFFIASVCFVSSLDFTASLKANLIIMPSVLLSILFLFFANIRNFSVQRIFPVFGNGLYSLFVTGAGNIFAFSGIVFLYFIPPLLQKSENFKKVAIISVLVSALYLILTISLLLFMFSFFMDNDQIMPLYTAATYIEFGSFFQRQESVFLLIWMMAFACFISIVNNFVVRIFQEISGIKEAKIMVYPIGILILATALIPNNYANSKYFETVVFPKLAIGIIFILGIVILILANIKNKKVSDKSRE